MLFSDKELIESKSVQLIFYAAFNICTDVKSNGSEMKTPLYMDSIKTLPLSTYYVDGEGFLEKINRAKTVNLSCVQRFSTFPLGIGLYLKQFS